MTTPNEPFTREPGYLYIVTDAEKRAAEPKLATDEYCAFEGCDWNPVYSYSKFNSGGIYRRRIAPATAPSPDAERRRLAMEHLKSLSEFLLFLDRHHSAQGNYDLTMKEMEIADNQHQDKRKLMATATAALEAALAGAC